MEVGEKMGPGPRTGGTGSDALWPSISDVPCLLPEPLLLHWPVGGGQRSSLTRLL